MKLGKLNSDEPTLRLKVKAGGAERMRRVALRLPVGSGSTPRAFAAGVVSEVERQAAEAEGGKHTGRTLKLKGKRSRRFVGPSSARGRWPAEPGHERPDAVQGQGDRDVSGKRTKLKVRLEIAPGRSRPIAFDR